MKELIKLEVLLQVSPKLLYQFISTEEGLSKWFADKVNIINNKIEFYWGKTKHEGQILSKKEFKYFKFSWLEDLKNHSDYYIEFYLMPTDQPNFTILKITDFTESEERDAIMLLWQSHIEQLKRSLGLWKE